MVIHKKIQGTFLPGQAVGFVWDPQYQEEIPPQVSSQKRPMMSLQHILMCEIKKISLRK